MACTVLASMVVLVVLEAFVPLGSVPPPVWGRGVRARLARAPHRTAFDSQTD